MGRIITGRAKKYAAALVCVTALLAARTGFCGYADSTDLLFDNAKVFSYGLEFYIENWEQQLKNNYDSGQVYMPAKFTYGTMVLDSVGVRYKGNSSYVMSLHTRKKPFKFKFDKYKPQKFFGIEVLNFSNCVKDPSFMRERISYDIARRYMPAPRTSYVNLSIGGELIGLYVQVEQIDKFFLRRHFPNRRYNLYKVGDQGGGLTWLGAEQSAYESIYELKTNEDINDWSAFITMIDKLNNTPASSFADTMKNYLHLESCINNLAFNMVFSHFDSYTGSGRNYYFYDDSVTGGFFMLPWDCNETFGAFTNNWNVITQDIITLSNLAHRPLNRRILENDSLRQRYVKKIRQMITGHALPDTIAALADRTKPLIESHVSADRYKLYTSQNFTTNIENDVYLGPQGSIPGIKSFARRRTAELQKQIDNIPIITEGKIPGLSHTALYNTPNPFRAATTIHFNNPAKHARVAVYSLDGKELWAVTTRDTKVTWRAPNRPSGVYLVTVCAGNGVFRRFIHAIK